MPRLFIEKYFSEVKNLKLEDFISKHYTNIELHPNMDKKENIGRELHAEHGFTTNIIYCMCSTQRHI